MADSYPSRETVDSLQCTDTSELVIGELETDPPDGQTPPTLSIGHPATCNNGFYCCVAAV